MGALVAAAAYAVAGFAAYQLIAPVLDRGEPGGAAVEVSTPGAGTLSSLGPEGLTLRAIAGRAKTSTYTVEAAGGANGSGFVAWVQEGKRRSYVITARSVVAGVLADGGRQVYLKRGNRFWPARIVRADPNWGLALLQVGVAFERPLWQDAKDDRGSLARETRSVVVPAGGEGFGEGPLINPSGTAKDWLVPAKANRSYLGAPVIVDDGRVAGVVVGLESDGRPRVAPLAAACKKIRDC